MTGRLFILILFLPWLNPAYGQYEHATVIGNVKSMWLKEYEAELQNGKIVEIGIEPVVNTNYRDEYDKKGRLIKREFYFLGQDDDYSSIAIYEYDKNSNLISTKEYNRQNELLSTETSVYNESNNLILFEEDGYGHNFNYLFYGKNNELIADKWMRIKRDFFKEPDTSWFNVFKFYDDSLRLIKEEKIFNDSLYGVFFYEYDSLGQVSSCKHLDANGAFDRMTYYYYNTSGFLEREMTFNSQKLLLWQVQYSYDDYGNCVKQERLKPDGKLTQRITCEYEYDGQGNWIKLTESWSNTHDIWVTYREIEYW